MDIYNSKGWKNRRKLSELNSYENADDERLAVRRERQRIYDEAAAADEAARVAYEAANAAAECRCTACAGTGRLPIPKAMRVVKALHNFGFSDHPVTAKETASLAAIAKGDPIPPGCAPVTFSYGSVSPAPGTMTPPVAPVAADTSRPAKGKKSELPESRTVETVTHDGFLIEAD